MPVCTDSGTGVRQMHERASTDARTGVRGKRVRASTRMNTEHAKWWRIAVNDIYAFKSNESAYKGVQSRISTKESDREKMSNCLALRATQEEAGWFTLQANCLERWHTERFAPSGTDSELYQNGRLRTTETGVRQVQARAFDRYGHGRSAETLL